MIHTGLLLAQIVLQLTAFCFSSGYLPIASDETEVSHIHTKIAYLRIDFRSKGG